MGQGAPLAARAIHIQDGVDHFAHVGGARMASWLSRRNERFQDRPFLLREIAWIASSLHLSTSSSFPSRDALSFFTPPVFYYLGRFRAEPLARPFYRSCPPSSPFSSLCTQPLRS